MSRHLTWAPLSGQTSAGLFPATISANSVYDLASIMDQPFDTRSGVDPIRAARLLFGSSIAGGSNLSSLGLLTSNQVSGLGANEMGVVSGNGYEIAVGQTVGGGPAAAEAIEIEYDERGMVERPL